MKGLELAERFYLTHGLPMLEEQFAAVLPHIAVGLAGSGSECFGFDDTLSQDHDFEPGFCLFLPDEDTVDRRTAFLLERAYAKLPREFMGFTREPLSPVGGNRHGVLRLADFLEEKTGRADGRLAGTEWFFVPEQALAEVTNGRLFFDGNGHFTALREQLAYLPEDVRRKKLAGQLLLMGQAGQYNYARCVKRGETAAAQLAAVEFVKSALHTAFLLNRTYLPYYKWQFRALRGLPCLAGLAAPLEHLLTTGNLPDKERVIEEVAAAIVAEVREQRLSAYCKDDLEGHAYAVNNAVEDATVRNLHILYTV